ncbi:MAG: adenine nucleotide alpha hydrolase family protein [Candidatus Heimdallarchaeota archaeon]|nr:adenine nucleotide alpha hydrolase family protein [Candidatus Heimdallarchaeota archaeon]
MTLCICGKNGAFKIPRNRQTLCIKCFSAELERSVVNRLPKHIRGHIGAVALSGGKDSITLLNILIRNQKKLRIPELFTITIEEGIPEIDERRGKILKNLETKFPNVKFLRFSYQDLFGYTLPEFLASENQRKYKHTPCAICGVLRRHALIRAANSIRADFIALGNTLNDEAATTLINIIGGNPEKNYRYLIEYKSIEDLYNPKRIKPLEKLEEASIIEYVNINNLETLEVTCPYSKYSLRSEVNIFLSTLKLKHPDLLFNITAAGKRKINTESQTKILQQCENCPSLTPKQQCSACRLIAKYFGAKDNSL